MQGGNKYQCAQTAGRHDTADIMCMPRTTRTQAGPTRQTQSKKTTATTPTHNPWRRSGPDPQVLGRENHSRQVGKRWLEEYSIDEALQPQGRLACVHRTAPPRLSARAAFLSPGCLGLMRRYLASRKERPAQKEPPREELSPVCCTSASCTM